MLPTIRTADRDDDRGGNRPAREVIRRLDTTCRPHPSANLCLVANVARALDAIEKMILERVPLSRFHFAEDITFGAHRLHCCAMLFGELQFYFVGLFHVPVSLTLLSQVVTDGRHPFHRGGFASRFGSSSFGTFPWPDEAARADSRA